MNEQDEWNKAWSLIAAFDAARPLQEKEYRLYYNQDGTVIGLWESGFPDSGEYLILDNPDEFHRQNTGLIRIVNKKIKLIDPTIPIRVQLKKSSKGQPVVAGNAALALMPDEVYTDIEFYEQTNN